MTLTHCSRQSYIYHVHMFHHKTENKTPVIFFFLHNLLLTLSLWSIFGANDWTAEIKTGLHPSSAHGPTIFAPNMLHCLNPVGKLPTVKIPLSCMNQWLYFYACCNFCKITNSVVDNVIPWMDEGSQWHQRSLFKCKKKLRESVNTWSNKKNVQISEIKITIIMENISKGLFFGTISIM